MSEIAGTGRLGPGGNNPPIALEDVDPENLLVVPVEQLPEVIDHHYAGLKSRALEFEAGIEAWMKAHDNGAIPIADDAEFNRLSDWMRQLRDFAGDDGEVEETRKKIKLSVFHAGKVIDAWFNAWRHPIMTAHGPPKHALLGTLQYAQTQYLMRKEAAARAERERIANEARIKAEQEALEAARLAEAGKAAEADAATEKAIESEQHAEALIHAAQAPTQDLTRMRSSAGTTTGLHSSYTFRLVDLRKLCEAIGKGEIPYTVVQIVPGAINKLINAKHGRLESVPGLEIEQIHTAQRRGA